MVSKFPYTVKPSSLKDFLQKIPTNNVPPRVVLQTLEALGYKSKNDRAIIPILKFLGFVDASGTPTEKYRQFRNKAAAGAVMAAAVKTAYSELYALYPDAHNKDTEALRNFFSTQVSAGEDVLQLTVSTFKTLCEFANFEAELLADVAPAGPGERAQRAVGIPQVAASPGLVVNLNIQLQLPPSEDPTVYDKIFESLKKHLLEH